MGSLNVRALPAAVVVALALAGGLARADRASQALPHPSEAPAVGVSWLPVDDVGDGRGAGLHVVVFGLVEGAVYELQMCVTTAGLDPYKAAPFYTSMLSVGADDGGALQKRVGLPPGVGKGRFTVAASILDTFPGLGSDDALVTRRSAAVELAGAPRAEDTPSDEGGRSEERSAGRNAASAGHPLAQLPASGFVCSSAAERAQPSRLVVFSFHCNRADFVRLQGRALQKWMQDAYRWVVINDAQTPAVRAAIDEAAHSFGAESVHTPPGLSHGDASKVVGHIMTWAVQTVACQRFSDALLLLLEGDMFPVAAFSPHAFLEGHHIAGTLQSRLHPQTHDVVARWLWVGLMLIDLRDIPNRHLIDLNVATVQGVPCDTGGAMDAYFLATPHVKARLFSHTSHIEQRGPLAECLPEPARHGYLDSFKIEIFEQAFLHYGSASNWLLKQAIGQTNLDHLPSDDLTFEEWRNHLVLHSNVLEASVLRAISSPKGRRWMRTAVRASR